MSSLSCGTLCSTMVFVRTFLNTYVRIRIYRHFECSVLVVWREGHTRSHSEHGSQAS
jgi:hypothetical protein